jgi:hypothetical protein
VQRPSNFDEIANDKLKLEQTIVISVSDTGIGIPQEKQKVIFEAFQQVDGTTSRRYGGTGLGLSISRQLAQLLGGELKLLSVEGKGSTFTLYLPMSVAKKVSTPTNPTAPPTLVMPLGDESKIKQIGSDLGIENLNNELGIKPLVGKEDRIADDRMNLTKEDKSILIIEDDRDFGSLLMELAQEKNFKCIVAEDGKTGLEFAPRVSTKSHYS